jgi:hypothetical protein
MSIFIKGLTHENTCYILLAHTKVTFLTKFEAEDLVKMDKRPPKWPLLSQIGHIEWIGFSQIAHSDLAFNQIELYDLTFSQINHIHLMN